MKLDTRIMNGKKPLNCFDTEEAESYVGKECYFSADVFPFANMSDKTNGALIYKGILLKVWPDGSDPYETDSQRFYTYCLPCDWVTVEKKYRPLETVWSDKMKLDERIPDRKFIFDCFSADKAKEYVGENCYMTDDFPLFEDLDFLQVYKLDAIDNSQFFNETEDHRFDYCLPVRFVKPVEKEKEYKPFDPVTFEQHYGIGSVIKYRSKDEKHITYRALVESSLTNESTKITYFVIRGYSYTLEGLFNHYELCEYGEWKPFGVKEE